MIRSLVLLLVSLIVTSCLKGQSFENPILPGGYPDPSICRVGDTYYMVNSSFEYFPGLPIHKSTDLVNWELIGYGLDRPEQVTGSVNLVDVQSNGGIHAPSIRYKDGLFYLITTNVYYHEEEQRTDFVNFILWTEDPAGPWSDPVVIEGAPGIDPDIFFDDDGRVWYVGTNAPDNASFPGEGEIWLQELDHKSGVLKGERFKLWRGACGGVWAEGPHIYKYKGTYYLLIAEGGTSYNHAVMVAQSQQIQGPYISNERNPILTSRHLSYDYWVNSIGHGDLVELDDGRWYMCVLGIRNMENGWSNMGRETFLAPLVWEREPFEWKEEKLLWPVVSPETGRMERYFPLPFSGTKQNSRKSWRDDFETDALSLDWNFRRLPRANAYEITEGSLVLNCLEGRPADRQRSNILGIRQWAEDFVYSAKLSFVAKEEEAEAGLILFQKDDQYLSFTIVKMDERFYLTIKEQGPKAELQTVKTVPVSIQDGEILDLSIGCLGGAYTFSAMVKGKRMDILSSYQTSVLLSKGYTGAYTGLCAFGKEGSTSSLEVSAVEVRVIKK